MFDWLPAYERFLVDITLIEVLLVLSVTVLFQCGLFSLASAGFAAVGAYSSALLAVDLGWPVPLSIAMGAISGGVLAALFGLPVLRLRGVYLALGSLALAQAIIVGISNVDFTNGARGIAGIPAHLTTTQLVIIVGSVCALLQLLHRSHFGRAMQAIRLDERTAQGLGIHVFAYRLTVFAASGFLAGLAGALDAHRLGVITPGNYGFALLIVVFTYALVGGTGHWVGAVVATVVLTIIRRNVGLAGSEWEDAVFGCLLIIVVVVAPNGLTDRTLYRKWLDRRSQPATVESASTAGAPNPEPVGQ